MCVHPRVSGVFRASPQVSAIAQCVLLPAFSQVRPPPRRAPGPTVTIRCPDWAPIGRLRVQLRVRLRLIRATRHEWHGSTVTGPVIGPVAGRSAPSQDTVWSRSARALDVEGGGPVRMPEATHTVLWRRLAGTPGRLRRHEDGRT